MKIITQNLGSDSVARGRNMEDSTTNMWLDIFTTSGVDDGAYSPAQHITVYGREAVENLKSLCEKMLEEANRQK